MTMKIELNEDEIDAIRFCLVMRANYIESGDINLSANDAIDRKILPKKLTTYQKGLVAEHLELAERLRLESQ